MGDSMKDWGGNQGLHRLPFFWFFMKNYQDRVHWRIKWNEGFKTPLMIPQIKSSKLKCPQARSHQGRKIVNFWKNSAKKSNLNLKCDKKFVFASRCQWCSPHHWVRGSVCYGDRSTCRQAVYKIPGPTRHCMEIGGLWVTKNVCLQFLWKQ